VPAVTGFERSGAKGFSHPVVKGAVVLKTDLARITERCESLIEEMEQKKIKKDRQMA
jgi:Rad4 beta-hairpin domain 3